jgi:hypothetical protein
MTQTDSDSVNIPDSDTLDLKISDPVLMLNEIARRYESSERILMEYIDNALDDAESLYRENKNKYPHVIKIEVMIDTTNQAVTVQDNCQGMTKETLERIVQNVGESQKRGLTWVNGRFGFGVQAFRAAAEVIHFQTCFQDNPHLALELRRDQHLGIPGARELAEPFPTDTGVGSMVVISGFEDEWFENITVDSIKEEIESHFERLLARTKLQITVGEKNKKPVVCKPFRYQDVPGKTIRHKLKLKLNGITYPIEALFKVAEKEVPGRGIRFFARGRRINHVTEIKSFIRKSTYRTSVWGHPHLLGYIEVGEIVRPVITRDDFVRNRGRIILYDALLALEDGIKDALDRINEAQRDTTLNRLELVLRKVLTNIARQDRQQIREQLESQQKIKPKPKVSKKIIRSSVNNTAKFSKMIEAANGNGNGNHNDPFGPAINGNGTADQANGSDTPDQPNHAADAPRRRRGFDIQFFDIPPDAAGQVKRSYMADNTIHINVAHPDFQERMTYTRQGQPKVTDRLGAYIAATVSIHYKDQFYAKYGAAPDRRDLLFDEQVDFMFRMEAALREYLPELEKELARRKQRNPVPAD